MLNQKYIALFLALAMFALLIAGCGSQSADTSDEVISEDASEGTAQGAESMEEKTVAEGKDTNNGRPYNLEPVKYDSRDDKYLNGINATVLPITEEPVTLVVWRSFTSTIMESLDECEVFKELEKRTGVHIEFVYPPVGQAKDNFNLRVATGDLPHIFSCPPGYPGGYHKAVEDGVYIELTPYYDKGLMPNIKWLRENYPEIDRDIVDDEGRMYFFPMIDIVPSHPWSGLWVREDWVKELGLELPETIEDWDIMLRAMKDKYGIAPLGYNIKSSYGVANNYAFAASYDVGYSFINKDGKVHYGPIEPGFKDYLAKMNEWYEEGLMDPDFATRDATSYNANVANGQYGAFTLNYGEMGQAKVTGRSLDPNYKITPVKMPTSYEGQVIRLRQNNSVVRGDRTYFTTRLVDEGLDEIAVKWQDYWYSQDGGDLCSYGPEGVSYVWGEDGEVEWIYPRLEDEELDFWTVFPLFKLHNWAYLRDSTAYEFQPEVYDAIETWGSQDASWVMPDNLSHTTEEERELANIMVNIETYRDEMTLKFIMGQEPLDKFDEFVQTIKSMNIDRAIEIKQAALDRYNNRVK